MINIMMLIFSSAILSFFGATLAIDRPIIGILVEEVSPNASVDANSMIAASYVKALEQSGARVAPIFINRTESYYRNLLEAVNGVVFPGGGVSFYTSGGFADAGRIIMDYTKKINSNGDNFPILGVCLGLELLLYLEVNNYSIMGNCNANNVALPLSFKKGFSQSRLYNRAPRDVVDILSNLPVTYNHHKKCITEELLSQHNLTNKWHVLSTSFDSDGKEFISSIERYGLPIVGIQFHPEKSAYEWNPSERIVHSPKAIHSARYFYDWLVREAQRNNHSFGNITEESEALIYNYIPTYISGGTGYFEQIYYFK